MADPASAVPDFDIPGYRIISELGEGGMARVYKALQESLEREIAVKVLSAELVSDPEFCQRFLKEGKTLARLSHPNIVTIYDSGEHEGVYYMCMELIRAGTLEDSIEKRNLTVSQCVNILKQVAEALKCAHEKGLIHRDIKPGNVLFRDDRTAVLSDFGIAKRISTNTTRMTAAGLAIGTPTYMSPEQARAEELTPASDQYSLGVMFYEMLSGQVPFAGDTSFSVALAHLQAPVPKLPQEYATLQPIIDKMMAKHPDERFATLEEMIAALENIAGDSGRKRATEIISPASTPVLRRRPVLLAGIGGLLALALVGGAYLIVERGGFSGLLPGPGEQQVELDPATRQEVDKWLEIAKTHEGIGRLTDPPGNNAMEAYEKVLELDPTNAVAREGLNEIAGTYERLARESLEKGSMDDFKAIVTEGHEFFPEHEGLASLAEQLPEG